MNGVENRIRTLIDSSKNKNMNFFIIGLEGTYDEETGMFESLPNKDLTHYHTVKLDEIELQYFIFKYKNLYTQYLENEKQKELKHYEEQLKEIQNKINNLKNGQ